MKERRLHQKLETVPHTRSLRRCIGAGLCRVRGLNTVELALGLFFLQWAQAESVLSEAGKNPGNGEKGKKGKHMNEQLSKATHKQIIPFALSYSYLHTPNLTLLTDTFSLYPLTHSLSLLHLLQHITKRGCACSCIQASVPFLSLSFQKGASQFTFLLSLFPICLGSCYLPLRYLKALPTLIL